MVSSLQANCLLRCSRHRGCTDICWQYGVRHLGMLWESALPFVRVFCKYIAANALGKLLGCMHNMRL